MYLENAIIKKVDKFKALKKVLETQQIHIYTTKHCQ